MKIIQLLTIRLARLHQMGDRFKDIYAEEYMLISTGFKRYLTSLQTGIAYYIEESKDGLTVEALRQIAIEKHDIDLDITKDKKL